MRRSVPTRDKHPRRRLAVITPAGEKLPGKASNPRATLSYAQRLAEVSVLERAQWRVVEELPYSTDELFLVTREGRAIYTATVNDSD